MSNRFVLPFAVATDPVNGVPLSGGKLFFYENKTSTKKDAYKNADLTTPHSNPVVADSGGYFPVIYTDGVYTVRLTDSDEVQIDETDDYEGPLFESQQVVDNKLSGDPPSATDSGTDDFEADFGRDVEAGTVVLVDFSSANTTTTPTLENTGGTPGALTITTKDGSALWANALSGVHTIQLASDGNSWLVLDPNPVSANSANAPVERDSNGRAQFSDPSAAQDAATKGWTGGIAARNAGPIYTGWVDVSGPTLVNGPSGWSLTKNATGSYTITHSLGLTDGKKMVVAPTVLSSAKDVNVTVNPTGTNSFTVKVFDPHSQNDRDEDFSFIAIDAES